MPGLWWGGGDARLGCSAAAPPPPAMAWTLRGHGASLIIHNVCISGEKALWLVWRPHNPRFKAKKRSRAGPGPEKAVFC